MSRHWALIFVSLVFVASVLRAEEIFGLTASGKLVRFDSTNPSVILATVTTSGLQTGETIVGIDFRPNTGQLYGVGSTSRLYVLDPVAGAATQIGAGQFTTLLSGNHFAVNFNPGTDRLRCVSETGQNLHINPDTGAVSVDTPLTYPSLDPGSGTAPRIVAIAYSNSVPSTSATGTTAYGIDSTADTLVTIGTVNGGVSPNTGVCYTVGKLGVNTMDAAGFDISGQTGIAYATFVQSGNTVSTLYTLDLATGTATPVGAIAAGELIYAIAVATAPTPYDIVGLRTNGQLVRFASDNPSLVASVFTTVSGLTSGDTLKGIVYRRSTGVLYGLGVNTSTNSTRIYTLNAVTGVAVQVTPPANPILVTNGSSDQGFTCDPVADNLRIMNEDGDNLTANPATGLLLSTDTTLAYANNDVNSGNSPDISTIAYTNVSAGAATLYGIDTTQNVLVTAPTPPLGILTTIGATNVTVSTFAGLDFSANGTAFAAINNNLYTINLTTGAATEVGASGIGGGTIRGIAAVPTAALATVQLTAANFAIVESNTAQITVSRTGGLNGVVSVDYAVTAGTAAAGTNFTPVSGTLTFMNGEALRTIYVPTLNDNKLDLFLTANITLSNPIGAVLGARSTGTLTITDINDLDGDGFPNDVEIAAGTNPSDAASTPFGGQAAGPYQPLTMTSTSVKLDFVKSGLDSMTFGGTLANPLVTLPTGTFIVQAGEVAGGGGVVQVFTFNSKGVATPKGLTLGKPKNGVSTFAVSLTKGTFAAKLAGAGLTNATAVKAPLKLFFNVYFNKTAFSGGANVLYSATASKTGSATFVKGP